MTGIYCYINTINQKRYIGQALDIQRRKYEHFNRYNSNVSSNSEYDSLIHRSMRKYGYDNFEFIVLEECPISKLNEREIYYIKYYNSLYPNGYNIDKGGNIPHFMSKNQETLDKLYFLLKDTNIKYVDISQQLGVSIGYIADFNNGKIWKNDKYDYPIRKKEKNINHCIDCGKLIDKSATRCMECSHKLLRLVERPNREQLLKQVATLGFTKTGNQYGVSANAIKKWCKGYGLPIYIKEIKELYIIEKENS